ncbi:NmrA-like domain containing protein [Parasponia andersonii]|uniref:NmrA-like domain containing protein n=1 Tax=Parasponia andersonii TaxID=3476 RepID=A0A2P5A6Y7_PARAD|nr:NmrA-like domain containing protein [Parasponia andersonii]
MATWSTPDFFEIDYHYKQNDKNNKSYIFNLISRIVLNYEEDVAVYTVKAATDPKVENRVIIYRPQGNITSQLNLISSWEKKKGRTLKRSHVPEEEIIELSESKTFVLLENYVIGDKNYLISIARNFWTQSDLLYHE